MTEQTLAPAPDALGVAAAPAAPAPATEAANPNVYIFDIAHTEPKTQISVDLSAIPAEVRMDMLKSKVREYVTNSVNQSKLRADRDNKPFDDYAKAIEADALQTVVPQPTGERKVADLTGTAAAARDRLYKGEVRKQGEGTGRNRAPKDPIVAVITPIVVREQFDKVKLSNPSYKWADAVKEVGGDGLAYLKGRIETLVAAGGDRASLEKYLDEKYVKPAELIVGARDTKATKDAPGLL